jgi:uncharacterized protein (DUF2062 family)
MKLHRLGLVITNGAISPAQLALSISLSVMLGLFPFFFLPTVFIVLAAFVLRLNLPVMMACNYIVWPLQIILFIPYIHLGNWLFGSNAEAVSFTVMVQAFRLGFVQALHHLLNILMLAAGAWAISSIPAGLLLYVILRVAAGAIRNKTTRLQKNTAEFKA